MNGIMKKNFIMIALASVLMMPVSCTKNELEAPQVPAAGELTFVAYAEGGDSKTTLNEEDGSVAWAIGDQIKFDYELEKVAGEAVLSSVLAEGNIVEGAATFTAALPEAFTMSTKEYEGESRHLYVTYPASIETDYSSASEFLVTIPAEQDGTFANASIALAKWDPENPTAPLQFYNLCGLLQIEIADDAARKIVLTSSTDIAGKMSVGFGTGVPAVKTSKNAVPVKEITVNVDGAGTYYVAVLPGELEDVYVAIYDEAYALLGDRTANNAIPVARRQIRKLGTIGTGFADRYYVKTTAAGSGDGSSWDNAADYAKLVTKLKETNSALTVYMASGTYKTGAVASMGTANTDANITIYGGYPAEATGMGISGRDYINAPTELDAESKDRIWVLQRGIWKVNGLTFKNAMRVSNATDTGSALIIEGNASSTFTIENCNFDSNQNATAKGGGAVRVSNANVNMRNCTFTNNQAKYFGSVIYMNGTSVLNMEGCEIAKNVQSQYDAAIYVNATSTLNITDCVFRENTAARHAAAISCAGKLNAVNCDFESNTAATSGGAIWARNDSKLTFNLCTFRSNASNGTSNENGGGSIRMTETSTVFLNRCFFANNTTKKNAFHIHVEHTTPKLGINNCVIRAPWGVSADKGSLLTLMGSSVVVNTTIYSQTGHWGVVSLGSTDENGCRIINNIVLNKSSKQYSFYTGLFKTDDANKYYKQIYNTIYSTSHVESETIGLDTYTDCLAGASCRDGGNFPKAGALWQDGTRFDLPNDRYIYIYPWEGTTDAGEVKKNSLADIKTLISGTANVGSDFLTWLESEELKVNGVEALAMDIRGVSRNTAAMWPGSYEDATATAGLESLNVK